MGKMKDRHYDLYGGMPPHNGTETSIEAARSVLLTAQTQRAEVYRHIRKFASYGQTCDEVERGMGLRHTAASARIRELVKTGHVKQREVDPKRVASSGRMQFVWVTT